MLELYSFGMQAVKDWELMARKTLNFDSPDIFDIFDSPDFSPGISAQISAQLMDKYKERIGKIFYTWLGKDVTTDCGIVETCNRR